MTYRVIIKTSYVSAVFEFSNMADAGNFANVAAEHAIAANEHSMPEIRIEIKRDEEETENDE